MFNSPSNLNLLFIITDQQRYDAIGYTNHLVKTPNLDGLADQSIVCRQAIVQSPQCQPSRASLLTGLYPDNIKMWWNETTLDPKYRTIGNHLIDNGYNTGYFGKLHIDGEPNYKQVANHYGFTNTYLTEDWIGLIQSNKDHAVNKAKHEFYSPMQTDIQISLPLKYMAPWTGKLSSSQSHHEDVVVNNAIRFLQQQKLQHKPFACFVSFHGPHPPYCSPPPFNDLYRYGDIPLPDQLSTTWFGHQLSKTDWHNIKAQYYGAIAWIDDYIGQILSTVDLSDTLVIFTSDHGDILGDHGYFSKGVFTYEGNVRVPLIIHWPGMGRVEYHHPVQLIDILPTVMDIMGLSFNDKIDGINLSQSLLSDSPVNEFAFSAIGINPRHYMARQSQYKYNIGDKQQFYDLVTDPGESVNHIDNPTYAEQLMKIRTGLSDHLSKLNNHHSRNASDCMNRMANVIYYS